MIAPPPATPPAPGSPRVPADLPAIGPVPDLRLSRPVRLELAGGTRAVIVAHPTVPRIELRLTLAAGDARATVPGSSELLGRTLLAGTTRRDGATLARALQMIGADLHVSQDSDVCVLSGSVLRDHEAALYELVAEVVTEAAFPNDELLLERGRLAEHLRMARATPHFPAHETIRAQLYGAHPYGRPTPTESQVRRCGPAAVRRLHQDGFGPVDAHLTVVGDVEPRRTAQRLRVAFGDWHGRRHSWRLPQVRHRPPSAITLIDRPEAVQTACVLAAGAPPLGHPDHLPLLLATAILGGGGPSRLMLNLRERHGYTYNPFAMTDSHLGDTLVLCGADVRCEVTAPALVEILYELGRLATTLVDPDELEGAQRYLAGTRVIAVQTQAGVAGSLASAALHGQDHRYLETFARRARAVTAADVRQVAARYLAPSRIHVVLVGPADAVAADVAALAPVTVRRGAARGSATRQRTGRGRR
ncbi:MAG TPA: pitrilysin family protein [Candidatus Micrarchaeia archaeon]|nr:pitrilysin family protein [Candidatus Micrarchaeia archaeon]